MLLMRSAQIQRIKERMVQDFEDRLALRLRAALPDATDQYTEAELDALIIDGMADSARHGIDLEWDIMRYVQWSILLGRDFKIRPETRWATEILGDASLDGTEKLDRIEARWLEEQRNGQP
jgi:hypothetical protein